MALALQLKQLSENDSIMPTGRVHTQYNIISAIVRTCAAAHCNRNVTLITISKHKTIH